MHKSLSSTKLRVSVSDRNDGNALTFSGPSMHKISWTKIDFVTIRRVRSRRSIMRESGTKNLTWNESTKYGLGFSRLTTRALGIWPLSCQENGSKFVFFLVIIVQLTLTFNLVNEFASGCVTAVNAAEFLPILGVNFMSLLKVIVIRMHWQENHCVVESAVNDWTNVCDHQSHKIMRRHAYLARLFFLIPMCIAMTAVSLLIIATPPTFDEEMVPSIGYSGNSSVMKLRNLPIGTGCFVVGIPTFLYLVVYFVEFMQLLYICNCEFGSDALFFDFTMHLCGQLELLRIDLIGLDKKRRNEIDIRNEIPYLIQRHNHLLCLLNLVEDTFNVIMLGKIVVTSMNISLLGIRMLLTWRDKDYVTAAFSSFAISFNLVQLYPYSLVGDYLSSNANDVRNAAYSCPWYNFSSPLTKDLIFVIMKSSRAFHLTAGKIFVINTESFMSIIKTTMSFFSFMKLTIVK